MYYKRRTLIFLFSHHPSHEVLWMTGHTERKRSASYRNQVEMLHIVERQRNNVSSEKAFYEALCVLHASGVSSTQKYEAQLTLHEAALRAMKRNLFRLHVFLPKIWAKKWGGRPDLNRRPSGPQPDALTNCATTTILFAVS